MEEAIKLEILYDLQGTIDFLQKKGLKDPELLKELSEHAINHVALYKDLDIISVTVFIYSLYKIIHSLKENDLQSIVDELEAAHGALTSSNFGRYNRSIKKLFALIRKSDVKVKEHLQDVMQAAKIKKGTALLEKGLSIGQAAGLMGLSNWDLQQYAGKTPFLGEHQEALSAKKRLMTALEIFNMD